MDRNLKKEAENISQVVDQLITELLNAESEIDDLKKDNESKDDYITSLEEDIQNLKSELNSK